jgi:hypothetical protein
MRKYIWSVGILVILIVLIRLMVDAFTAWDESYLKQVLVPIASVYLTVFSHQVTAVLLTGVMMLSGVAILVWLQFGQFAPAVRALRSAAVEIQRAELPGGGAERVLRFDRIFEVNPYLARDWRNYRRTLLVSPEVGATVWASVRPERYFTLNSLQRSGVDIGLLRSLPGYYVGFGLLFTFMGLVAGLYFASRGLMAADLAAARQSLIALLHASTFKFSTSVAGLMMSLLFSIYGRALIARLNRELGDFCDRLEAVFPPAPAHLIETVTGGEARMKFEHAAE